MRVRRGKANNYRATVSVADVEQDSSDASLGAEKTAGLAARCRILVTSYRHRMHDTDGVSCKAVLDGLVRRGLLHDDTAKEIEEISFRSVIVTKTESERTTIEITYEDK